MTHNFTISIAGKWLDDSNNPALTPEQRAAGKKAYEETIITASFPNKPDGTPIKYRSDVKTGLIFTAAKNKAEAKEFIKFLLQEENLRPYIEGALGRWFPVTSEGQKSAYWQADHHRRAVYNQFMDGTVPESSAATVLGIMSWMAYCDSSTLMPVLASNFLIASSSASSSDL